MLIPFISQCGSFHLGPTVWICPKNGWFQHEFGCDLQVLSPCFAPWLMASHLSDSGTPATGRNLKPRERVGILKNVLKSRRKTNRDMANTWKTKSCDLSLGTLLMLCNNCQVLMAVPTISCWYSAMAGQSWIPHVQSMFTLTRLRPPAKRECCWWSANVQPVLSGMWSFLSKSFLQYHSMLIDPSQSIRSVWKLDLSMNLDGQLSTWGWKSFQIVFIFPQLMFLIGYSSYFHKAP